MRQTGTHHFGATKYEEAKSAGELTRRTGASPSPTRREMQLFRHNARAQKPGQKHTARQPTRKPTENRANAQKPNKNAKRKEGSPAQGAFAFRISSPSRTLHSKRSFAAR